MRTRVCTLMWGTAWERYGRAFAETFDRHWAPEVELVVVTDHHLPMLRGNQISLDIVEHYHDFKGRHDESPAAHGVRPTSAAKVDDSGYSWRHDAMKWMPQALCPRTAAAGLENGDIFVWFDADTETTSDVPLRWVDKLLGDADVACLQRTGTHSEIGFYAIRISDVTRAALDMFAELYVSDAIFAAKEWHSAFAFDMALATEPALRIRNLSPGGKGHVWPKSPLAAHTIHKKGKRKDQ